jgi:hypothetical protein
MVGYGASAFALWASADKLRLTHPTRCGERPLFTFSGTIKRVKMRMPAAAAESNG